jgi:hypothetical protein
MINKNSVLRVFIFHQGHVLRGLCTDVIDARMCALESMIFFLKNKDLLGYGFYI